MIYIPSVLSSRRFAASTKFIHQCLERHSARSTLQTVKPDGVIPSSLGRAQQRSRGLQRTLSNRRNPPFQHSSVAHGLDGKAKAPAGKYFLAGAFSSGTPEVKRGSRPQCVPERLLARVALQ